MHYGYCSLFASGSIATASIMFLLSLSYGLCLGLMSCSSISMVHICYRCKRQVMYIHSTQYFLKFSFEDRATQVTLILLCKCVISYSFSSTVVIFTTYSKYPVLRKVKCIYISRNMFSHMFSLWCH
jgi:vomeronasal1 receptor